MQSARFTLRDTVRLVDPAGWEAQQEFTPHQGLLQSFTTQ